MIAKKTCMLFREVIPLSNGTNTFTFFSMGDWLLGFSRTHGTTITRITLSFWTRRRVFRRSVTLKRG